MQIEQHAHLPPENAPWVPDLLEAEDAQASNYSRVPEDAVIGASANDRTLSFTEATEIAGRLSNTRKMPWFSYDLHVTSCRVGAKLRSVHGSECERCYARAGFHIFPNPREAQGKRLEGLKHPRWEEAMEVLIRHELERTPPELRYFRWHASGDIQSLEHLQKVVEIAERIPEVQFWLQTKEVTDVQEFLHGGGKFPENLTVRLSSAMVGEPLQRLGLPYTVITPAGGTPSTGSFPCPATIPGGAGKCDDCRACWNPEIPLVAYYEHGKSARKLEQPKTHQPEGGTTMAQQPHAAEYPEAEESETRVSTLAASPKLTREEVVRIDDRIAEAFKEDKRDHTVRMLSIAPDVAKITFDKNFTLLNFRSKEKYFQSRHEAKPYMRALEIIGNSDVEFIRDLTEEYHLSWKDLQIFTMVESDPALLPGFIETHAAARIGSSIRKFESYLKSIKHPEKAAKKAQEPTNTMPEVAATTEEPEAVPVVSEQTPATWEELASDFERGLQILVGNLQRDDSGPAQLEYLKLRILTAVAHSLEELGSAPDMPAPAEVMVTAPITVDAKMPLAEYAAG